MPQQRVLRHVVLFGFKADATPAEVRQVVDAFRALPARISAIDGFEWGTDVSPEGKAQGFTHCFTLTFRTTAERDAYLPHPDHQAFSALAGPLLERVCVLDYWTEG